MQTLQPATSWWPSPFGADDQIGTPAGVNALGVETVPQIVTRGLLVDVGARGLEPGGVIGLTDVAGLDPEPGDAVLFHTGWGAHWDDPDTYLLGEPGPGLEL